MVVSVSGVSPDQSAHRVRLSWLPWALIALTPVALALVSWDTVGVYQPVQAWFRLYGTGAVAIELAVFVYSVLAGTEPLKALKSLPAWAKLALIVLIGVAFYTAIFIAPDGLRALQWTFSSLVHLLFGLAVSGLLRNSDTSERLTIWRAVALGGVGYLLIVVAFVVVATQRHFQNWEYFGLGGTNIRHVGFYSIAGAGAALGLGIAQQRTQCGWLYALAAASMLALSFWSGTRGALVAITAAFVLGTVLLPILRTAHAWTMFAASMIGGAFLSLAGPIPSPIYGILRLQASSCGGTSDVSSGRFDMWSAAWHAFLQRPVSGYGAGQYFLVAQDKFRPFNHPHDIVLQVLFQWGAVGAICYFSLAALVGLRAALALRDADVADLPAFLAGAALVTTSLYDGGLFNTYPTMMIAFALASIIAPRREPA